MTKASMIESAIKDTSKIRVSLVRRSHKTSSEPAIPVQFSSGSQGLSSSHFCTLKKSMIDVSLLKPALEPRGSSAAHFVKKHTRLRYTIREIFEELWLS
jgi:hypothetical protein